MTPLLTDEIDSIRRRYARFAERFIACRSDLYDLDSFPPDIWRAMAGSDLLGLSIPGRYGGMDGSALAVAAAGEALARQGGNMGLVLSWLIHQIVARFVIHDAGNEDQRSRYLPGLAQGEQTAALAISEPGRGGHPGFLKTRAERRGARYILNGEKTYLTNGPMADLYVVLAVTGGSDKRKEFTAFLIPRHNPGLSRTGPLALPFLRPAPHGGIILRDSPVPEENILGDVGTAYERLAIPFREYEDVMLMGPLAGGMERQLMLVTRALCRRSDLSGDTLTAMGELRVLADLLNRVAFETPAICEGVGHSEVQSLTLAFGNLAHAFQTTCTRVKKDNSELQDTELSMLTNDLTSMIALGLKMAAVKQRKLGAVLLSSAVSGNGVPLQDRKDPDGGTR